MGRIGEVSVLLFTPPLLLMRPSASDGGSVVVERQLQERLTELGVDPSDCPPPSVPGPPQVGPHPTGPNHSAECSAGLHGPGTQETNSP